MLLQVECQILQGGDRTIIQIDVVPSILVFANLFALRD